MARQFIDGFESGSFDLWASTSGASLVTPPAGMTGNYCASIPGLGYLVKQYSGTEVYLAYRWQSSLPNNIFQLNEFYKGTTVLGSLMVSSLGAITVLAYRGTTQIASSAGGVLSPNTVYLIEVYFKLGDSDGRWVVKADGVTILDFTGDTNPGSDADFDTIYFGGKTISTFYYGYIDDVRIDNANWIGDTVVLGIAPTGAGATTQWDPSAGANYACVDEVPPSDADYVSTNVNDEIDTYALGDLPVSPPIQSVKCVQVNARARKEGASTPQKIALVVRAGGTDYPSGDKVLTTSFKGHANLWEQNPNTAAAWTESGVNGIEAGVKARA